MSEDGNGDGGRGLPLVVKVVLVVLVLLPVLAIAGDDELRASLVSWANSPDRWWR